MVQRGAVSVPSYQQPSNKPAADVSQPDKKPFLTVSDYQQRSTEPRTTTLVASQTMVQRGAMSVPTYQQPSKELAADVSQPDKKQFLKVDDYQQRSTEPRTTTLVASQTMVQRGAVSVPSYQQASNAPAADVTRLDKKPFATVSDYQQRSTEPRTTAPVASETMVQRVAASVPCYQQPSKEPAANVSQPAKKPFKVVDYQQPSNVSAADITQPAKKSFLKVIDHQNQPADRSAGTGNNSGSMTHSWQSERRDFVSPWSRSEDLDYRQRVLPAEDTRRVIDRDATDLRRRLDVLNDRYIGPADTVGRGYRLPSDTADRSRYVSVAGVRNEFWNELSAYCDEYEARMGRRDDIGGDVTTRLPPPPAVGYSTGDLDRRRTGEGSMSERRGDVVDVGGTARGYDGGNINDLLRLRLDEELRRARAETDTRYYPAARDGGVDAAGEMRGRLPQDSMHYYRGSSSDRSARY